MSIDDRLDRATDKFEDATLRASFWLDEVRYWKSRMEDQRDRAKAAERALEAAKTRITALLCTHAILIGMLAWMGTRA